MKKVCTKREQTNHIEISDKYNETGMIGKFSNFRESNLE